MRTIILTEATRVVWEEIAVKWYRASIHGEFSMFVIPSTPPFEYRIKSRYEDEPIVSEPIYPDVESAMKEAESQLIQLLASQGRTVMVSEVKE